jgi:hypothetical protein
VGLILWKNYSTVCLDHINLKSLVLKTKLTMTSSHVLRSLLHCNETLERFETMLLESEKEFPTMATVLADLPQNTGLKEVLIQSDSSETDTILAAAWIDMLRRNVPIKIWTSDEEWEGDSDLNLSSAFVKGLMNNSTLEMVRYAFPTRMIVLLWTACLKWTSMARDAREQSFPENNRL